MSFSKWGRGVPKNRICNTQSLRSLDVGKRLHKLDINVFYYVKCVFSFVGILKYC